MSPFLCEAKWFSCGLRDHYLSYIYSTMLLGFDRHRAQLYQKMMKIDRPRRPMSVPFTVHSLAYSSLINFPMLLNKWIFRFKFEINVSLCSLLVKMSEFTKTVFAVRFPTFSSYEYVSVSTILDHSCITRRTSVIKIPK